MLKNTYLQKDFFLPIIVLFILMILFHESAIDIQFASHFFSPTGWIYRDSFLLEKVLHKGGVKFIILLLVFIVLRTAFIWSKEHKSEQKRFWLFTLISSVLTILVVYGLKKITTLPCPWNITHFSGSVVSPSIWSAFSFSLPNAHCFPAGHSSGGFGFLSLYYANLYVHKKRNFKMLLPGLLLGLVFGFAQQARGAHFLSHDVATALISITCAWVTTILFTAPHFQAK